MAVHLVEDNVVGDSDAELQEAFSRGELKPGLHALVPHVKRDHINNVTGLKRKLEEFKLDLDWVERLDMSNDPAPAHPELTAQSVYSKTKNNKVLKGKQEENIVHNDFEREMSFYRQGQAAVLSGILCLRKLGIPTKRPEDYFAEMAKSDTHMQKVREKLLSKQVALERSEKARKLRELRKFGKKIQNEVLQKRQKQKKEMLESVKKYRKGQTQNLDFLDGTPIQPKNSSQEKGQKRNKMAQQRKKYKDTRYGYGGQKKRSKYNTAQSSAAMSGFHSKKSSLPPGKKSKMKNKRPGKSRRQNMKSKKK
ncbi:probable rRNA-processing protein EBP2 isoform X2 [Limulus polyphemus]|uniref:Probable rRNA-processing protein EBP2 isoform X2 n=1 Tax=Limulus polyphemus TaxID=6850 RepID=A0ABM1T184_LIMPO|nr:probable rRNA-processing protein EBP2 isoform X2 [Limulus polyphemus]